MMMMMMMLMMMMLSLHRAYIKRVREIGGMQELKAREDDLNRMMLTQQEREQSLWRREQDLLAREFEMVEREIQMYTWQQQQEARARPPLRKRTGPVRRKVLDKFRSAQHISSPIGTYANYIVIITRRVAFSFLNSVASLLISRATTEKSAFYFSDSPF